MLKELINTLSDPIYSFSACIVLFFVAVKYYRFFASVKFGIIMLFGSVLTFLWCFKDPNFRSVVTLPDNIPIIILLACVGFFTWFSMHKASINDERMENDLPPVEGTPENREKVWSWPNLVYTELFAIIACTVFLIVWAILFKAPLEEPANPTWAPNPAKAPWYFLGLQEMLVYFDPWMAGVVLPGVIIVGLVAIPYIDVNPKGNGYYSFKDRKMAMIAFLFGWLVLWIYLIIIGTFLRGPNWTFYGPFEYWDFHKVVAANNVNLSEYLWVKGLGKPMPGNILVREFLGVIVTVLYFVIPTYFMTVSKWGKNLLFKMGYIRFYVFVFLILTMTSLPIKMYLRWFFNLKYIIAMPEFELNL